MNNDRFKFRVWNKEDKILHYGAENTYDYLGGSPKIFEETFGSLLSKTDEWEVEQCTGLKDKNGNLIYEGDVIQFTHNRGYFTNKGDIRVIEFSAFRFCGFGWRSRPENNVEFALTESAAKKCMVIGNIHEQAEQKDVK